jgi:hypothetical protein
MSSDPRLERTRNRIMSLTLAALLAGCATEPSPALGGDWSLSASYSGGDLTCMLQATLTLYGSGPSLSGRLAETRVDCTSNGTPLTITPDTVQVVGTADGRRLSFTPQSPEGESHCAVFSYEGQAAEDRMLGTVRTTPVFCQGTYTQLNGTWHAQRS